MTVDNRVVSVWFNRVNLIKGPFSRSKRCFSSFTSISFMFSDLDVLISGGNFLSIINHTLFSLSVLKWQFKSLCLSDKKRTAFSKASFETVVSNTPYITTFAFGILMCILGAPFTSFLNIA